MKNDKFLKPEQAAEYVGFKESTMEQWRFKDIGPKPSKISGKVFYHIEDLDFWLEQQRKAD